MVSMSRVRLNEVGRRPRAHPHPRQWDVSDVEEVGTGLAEHRSARDHLLCRDAFRRPHLDRRDEPSGLQRLLKFRRRIGRDRLDLLARHDRCSRFGQSSTGSPWSMARRIAATCSSEVRAAAADDGDPCVDEGAGIVGEILGGRRVRNASRRISFGESSIRHRGNRDIRSNVTHCTGEPEHLVRTAAAVHADGIDVEVGKLPRNFRSARTEDGPVVVHEGHHRDNRDVRCATSRATRAAISTSRIDGIVSITTRSTPAATSAPICSTNAARASASITRPIGASTNSERAHRPGNPDVGSRHDIAGDDHRCRVDLGNTIAEPVLIEAKPVRSERVCLDHVDPPRQRTPGAHRPRR